MRDDNLIRDSHITELGNYSMMLFVNVKIKIKLHLDNDLINEITVVRCMVY